jgi:hypothetical protein
MTNPNLQSLANQYQAQAICLSNSGQELLVQDPVPFEAFLEAAQALTGPHYVPRDTYECIGTGYAGVVRALPGFGDMCLKVVDPQSSREVYVSGAPVRPASLIPEMKFMDALGRHLARNPEEGVRTPLIYGVAKFAGGSALLQQRTPPEFVTVKSLRGKQNASTDVLDQQTEIAYNRVRRALNGSLLRFGMNYLGDAHGGNIFLHQDSLAEGNEIYVVDQVGRKVRQRVAARAIAFFAR